MRKFTKSEVEKLVAVLETAVEDKRDSLEWNHEKCSEVADKNIADFEELKSVLKSVKGN